MVSATGHIHPLEPISVRLTVGKEFLTAPRTYQLIFVPDHDFIAMHCRRPAPATLGLFMQKRAGFSKTCV